MHNSYLTPVDPDVYTQLLSILGLNHQLEPIDVQFTVGSVLQPARHARSRQIAQSLGAAAGHVRNVAVKIPKIFNQREIKASVMVAHWASWSLIMIGLMSMTTSAIVFFAMAGLWIYVSQLIFESIQNFR